MMGSFKVSSLVQSSAARSQALLLSACSGTSRVKHVVPLVGRALEIWRNFAHVAAVANVIEKTKEIRPELLIVSTGCLRLADFACLAAPDIP